MFVRPNSNGLPEEEMRADSEEQKKRQEGNDKEMTEEVMGMKRKREEKKNGEDKTIGRNKRNWGEGKAETEETPAVMLGQEAQESGAMTAGPKHSKYTGSRRT